MLEEPWKAMHVNVSHLTVLNERYEEPEGHDLVGMIEERPHNKVHALHIVNLMVIVGESCQDPSHLLNAWSSLFVIVMKRERPAQVSADLILRFLLHLLCQELLVTKFKLPVVMVTYRPCQARSRIIATVPIECLAAQIWCALMNPTLAKVQRWLCLLLRFRLNFLFLLWLCFLRHLLIAKDPPYLRYQSVLEVYEREPSLGFFGLTADHARFGGVRRVLLMFRGIFNQKRVWLLGIHRGRPELVIERGGCEGGRRGSLRDKLADATALSW